MTLRTRFRDWASRPTLAEAREAAWAESGDQRDAQIRAEIGAAEMASWKLDPPPAPRTLAPHDLPGVGDKLEDQVNRSQHAERLLEDPLLRWVMTEIKSRIRDAWETSPIRDDEGQRHLRLMIEIAAQFESHLVSLVTEGRIAQDQLVRIERGREHEKKYGPVPL